ncbi:MAG TPA: GNAT family N-acetyltransferase [Amnibacterium sp.]
MIIREERADDWPQIFPFFRDIVEGGETYAYPDGLSSADAERLWTGQGRVVVAVDGDTVLGTATMGPNRPGRGSHVATGSFMVDPAAAGRGVGRALGTHLIEWATRQGFAAIQFNAVVETNAAAVHLWQSLGFRVVGTVPKAFHSRRHGLVGLHVMWRPLSPVPEERRLAL